MRKLQVAGFVLAAIFLFGMLLVPTSDLLTVQARNLIGIILAVITLLVTEALPMAIVCLLAVPLMVLFGCVATPGEALSGFTNHILFFVVASFGISEALTTVPLSRRFVVGLMGKFGGSTKSLLFAIMACTCLISSIISNVVAAVVFIPVVQNFLDIFKDEEERARTARCFMIALPIASMVGGIMTPAGSSINMMIIGLLEKNAEMTIPFVQWMLFGIPLAIIMLPVAWFFCDRVYKPAAIDKNLIKEYVETIRIKEKISGKETYVMVIIGTMLVLWILSSWIPIFQITVVALIGLALFFIPGKEILTWKSFVGAVSWQAFILLGVMISIAGVVNSSGLSTWIASIVFPETLNLPLPIIVGFISLITLLLLIPIPNAPAVVSFMAAPLVLFAGQIGVSPYILLLTLGVSAGQSYFLPLDTVPLMTLSTGAYKVFDMPKASKYILPIFVVVTGLWVTLASIILGIS